MSLENWLEIGKIKRHSLDREEISAIFAVADRNFQDASLKGLSSDQKYILSYQAAFEAGMALLNCHGYKPIKTGHHYITWQCLKCVLPEIKHSQISLFEDAAKKRSKLSYDMAGLASSKEADEMHKEAVDFVDFVREHIRRKFNIKA